MYLSRASTYYKSNSEKTLHSIANYRKFTSPHLSNTCLYGSTNLRIAAQILRVTVLSRRLNKGLRHINGTPCCYAIGRYEWSLSLPALSKIKTSKVTTVCVSCNIPRMENILKLGTRMSTRVLYINRVHSYI